MTREEAINELNKVFTSAYANYIVTALTEGATVSDFQRRYGRAYEAGVKDGLEQEPCEDAVSRKKVIDVIYHECSGENLDIDFAKVLLLQRAIKALPPVTPQEPILDKIRAEIHKAWCTHPQSRYEEGLKDQALRDVKIIDKYRTESEARE